MPYRQQSFGTISRLSNSLVAALYLNSSDHQLKILFEYAENAVHVIESVIDVKRNSQSVVPAGTDDPACSECLHHLRGILALQNTKRSDTVGRRLSPQPHF